MIDDLRVEWDWYWEYAKNGSLNKIYGFIASLYRKLIISPALSYFLKKNFGYRFRLIHAGCGGGEVDRSLSDFFQITAVDFSKKAILLYKKNNPRVEEVTLANIFDLPFEDGCFDGAYNLGVLEHYRNEDVVLMLEEIARTVRVGGRIVVFWPPEFGLSVLFFKLFYFFIGIFVNRRVVKFYPDEINRLKSSKHAEIVFRKARIKIVDFYFGWRTFFTYYVVVGEVGG